jgi:hypothetical protein
MGVHVKYYFGSPSAIFLWVLVFEGVPGYMFVDVQLLHISNPKGFYFCGF